jgi:hypothetical protein
MINKGTCFLDLTPRPPPYPRFRQQVLFLRLPVCRRSSALTGERGGGGGGGNSCDREKAWSSINHSILSGTNITGGHTLYRHGVG